MNHSAAGRHSFVRYGLGLPLILAAPWAWWQPELREMVMGDWMLFLFAASAIAATSVVPHASGPAIALMLRLASLVAGTLLIVGYEYALYNSGPGFDWLRNVGAGGRAKGGSSRPYCGR